MQIQNLIYFNWIQFFQYLTSFRFKVKLSHSTMVLGPTIPKFNSFKYDWNKVCLFQINSIQFKSIQLFAFLLYLIQFHMFQDFVNIWIISGLTFFLHHGLRSTDIIFNQFQFQTHAHFIPAKIDFWYIKVCRYNIFNFILFNFMLSFVNKNMFQNFVYIVNLHYFRSNFFSSPWS